MKYLVQILVACVLVVATWFVTRELEKPRIRISVASFSITQPENARIQARGIDKISEFFSDDIVRRANDSNDSFIDIEVQTVEDSLSAAIAKQDSFRDSITKITGFSTASKSDSECERLYNQIDSDFSIDIYELLDEEAKNALIKNFGVDRNLTWCQTLLEADKSFKRILVVNQSGIDTVKGDLRSEKARLRQNEYGLFEILIQNFGGRSEIIQGKALLTVDGSSKVYRLDMLEEIDSLSYSVVPPHSYRIVKYRTQFNRSSDEFSDIQKLDEGAMVLGNIRFLGSDENVWISENYNFSFASSNEEQQFATLARNRR